VATTNFSALTTEQKTVWERDVWKNGRNANFFSKFVGGSDAMVHRVTELTRDERGTRAVMTLVADLEGDGVAGDNELEGNEEAIRAFDKVINIDQMRHANKSKGRLAEQSSVVNFRQQSRDVLAHWIGDRLTQQMFLLLSGEALTQNTNGTARTGSQFAELSYAAAVAPSANRGFNWDNTTTDTLIADNTATIAATDLANWEMLINMKAKAQEQLLKPIRMTGDMAGMEVYNVFVTPNVMKQLKTDTNFLTNLREAMPRTPNHPLFKGANTYYVDGMAIHVHNHVYHASDWGAGGNVPGAAVLMCGAQALGFADIGVGEWVEKTFDYDSKPGIAYSKICGLLKPQFRSDVTGVDEDFGVMRVNVYNG
jgi:N4-gp56 family major capsid protein